MVLQGIHSTTVTGQTFFVRYVERFHFFNLLLLDYKLCRPTFRQQFDFSGNHSDMLQLQHED